MLAFLDLSGAWDPSLAFVMMGAIAVDVFAFAIARRRTVSCLGSDMKLPTARRIDRRLLGGSILFGIGWGIAGWCPGPALASLTAASVPLLAFLAAMLVGLTVVRVLRTAGAASPGTVPSR